MVALGDVRGPPGGLGASIGGGQQVAAELMQVPAGGVPPVAVADHAAERVHLARPGGGTEDMVAPFRPFT